MNVTISPSVPNGTVRVISSKSAAHRLLICAAFADSPTVIRCDNVNDDIRATAQCLGAIGAKISYERPYFSVTPLAVPNENAVLDCKESGSTLRFLLPVVCALGINAEIRMSGRLPNRPLSPLYEQLVFHGARLSPQGSNPLLCGGKLTGGEYRLRGDVSSQFISGLLFALTFSRVGGSVIIEGTTESAPYIDMTVNALERFGASPQKTSDGYEIDSNAILTSPRRIEVEGDWSGAAFPLCMGAVSNSTVTVTGLDPNSKQGDRAIIDILRDFGADVIQTDNAYTVRGGNPLRGMDIDATQIPDAVPALAAVAAVSEGRTHIYGAARLRHKESDRIASVCAMLTSLGADVRPTDDGMIIHGKKSLSGGTVDSFGDHRIAMSAAVASVACTSRVTVTGAECVSKSYGEFWEHTKKLGLKLEIT